MAKAPKPYYHPQSPRMAADDPVAMAGILESLGMLGGKAKTGASAGFQSVKNFAGNPRVLGGAAGLGSLAILLQAAGELGDENDPAARNIAQAAGRGAGGFGGMLGGAALGTMVGGPIGTVIGGGLGAFGGGELLSNAAGGIYDLITDESPDTRRRRNEIKDANVKREIAQADAAVALSNAELALKMKRLDDFERLERQLQATQDLNYSNALNQGTINQQAANAQAQQAMTQYIMS